MTDTVAGQPLLRLQAADGASAAVSPFGAQLLSWCPAAGGERLFLSARAVLDGSGPVRGGVPVVFPQFAGYGPLPAHGVVRDRLWRVCAAGATSATLALADDAALRALWPHAFACEVRVAIGGPVLTLELHVINTGDTTFAFQAALHTYLCVDDLASLRVEGLRGARYRDRTAGDREAVQHDAALAPDAAGTDRIYLEAPGSVVVREPQRALAVASSGGFGDLVVWNPGAARCATVADLEPDAWRRLLCIEAARIVQPQTLAPGERWRGAQTLTAL